MMLPARRVSLVLLVLMVCLMSITNLTPAAEPTKKLAIVDFSVLNFDQTQQWGRDLADLVRHDETLNSGFRVVAAEELQKCLTDQGIQVWGEFDQRNLAALATALGADYVAAGSLLQYGRTRRLECTLLEATPESPTGTLYRCRQTFTDPSDHPDVKTASDAARSILEACKGESRRKFDVVMDDDLSADQPDAKFWIADEFHDGTTGKTGEQWHDAWSEDGWWWMSGKAKSDSGWSSSQFVWLQSLLDLNDGQDFIVELVIQGEARNCVLAATLVSDPKSTACTDPAITRYLFERVATHRRPRVWETIRMRIEVSGASQLATVYSSEQAVPERTEVSLNAFAFCGLRLFLNAHASSGAPIGTGTIRIDHVSIVQIDRDTTLSGRVVDSQTQRPICDAVVSLPQSGQRTRTDAAGRFEVDRAPGSYEVVVEKPNYASEKRIVETLTSDQQPTETTIALVRSSSSYGDIVCTIPISTEKLHLEKPPLLPLDPQPNATFSAVGDYLLITIPCTNRSPHYQMCAVRNDGTRAIPITTLPLANAIAVANGELLLVGNFPAHLYRCVGQGSQEETDLPRELLPFHNVEPELLIELTRHFNIDFVTDVAFDGTFLWFVETDGHRMSNAVGAIDVASLVKAKEQDKGTEKEIEVTNLAESSHYYVTGIACDRESARLWLAAHNGGDVTQPKRDEVLEIDTSIMRDNRALTEACIKRRFPGRYETLEYSQGSLWGFDAERNELCRIDVTEAK